ncbi:hypothetical protein [Candidatus Trichorickettsia mobilis]|uniref:hypothetical protein n=1 Tax=Candidatus Trichorickettsia mobilis TaxID=1346319 RepID=UPI0029307D54|nr:hypothetical protein [Candidatus Trichorickettsia mobilis]
MNKNRKEAGGADHHGGAATDHHGGAAEDHHGGARSHDQEVSVNTALVSVDKQWNA